MPGPTDDTGERLAAWLEGLGLSEQLAAAGLPTYDRTGDAVHWVELGQPVRAELDRQLRAHGQQTGAEQSSFRSARSEQGQHGG